VGPAAVRDRRHPLSPPGRRVLPERGHVHHDACRCDSTRKTIPGWEYQFTAALGHLRTAWAALVDVERTTPATRTRQTARQVQNLLRRLPAAGPGGRGAPLVIMDAGYPAPGKPGHPMAARSPRARSAADLQTSGPAWEPPPVSLNPLGPAPDGPGLRQRPGTPPPGTEENRQHRQNGHASRRVRG
jgi:hypothetical protein